MIQTIDRVTLPAAAPKSRRRSMLVEMVCLAMGAVLFAGLMLGLLLPAVVSRRAAPTARVQTEIRGLESAILQFRSLYGIDPPSRIRLYEAAEGAPSWTSHPGTFEEPITGQTVSNDFERTRSTALILRLWPNFDFKLARDLNSDGDTEDVVSLNGAECLVFFLGGRFTGGEGQYALSGFSMNPMNPFAIPEGVEARHGPFFEFKQSQLRPSLNPAASGFLVYFDSHSKQTAPFIYASSDNGHGYERTDLFVNSQADLSNCYVQSGAPASISLASKTSGPPGSPPSSLPSLPSPPQPKAWKDRSFQLISPGVDGLYGSGGLFDMKLKSHGLVDRRDDDNITNFQSGKLNASSN
jgi:hypothetical protein